MSEKSEKSNLIGDGAPVLTNVMTTGRCLGEANHKNAKDPNTLIFYFGSSPSTLKIGLPIWLGVMLIVDDSSVSMPVKNAAIRFVTEETNSVKQHLVKAIHLNRRTCRVRRKVETNYLPDRLERPPAQFYRV